jgi:short-subunit dehydrogenase
MRKLVIVTGGTRGIGRAIIERFAAANIDIAACARKSGDLQSLKTDVEEKYKIRAHTFRADLTDRQQVDDFIKFVSDLGQPVDVLVNNAGFFSPGDICTEPDGNLERMVNANLYSAYHLTRGLVGGMKALRRGHIFNMCSIASIVAYPNGGSYAITKFAMLGFSKCLRAELKDHGIRVTAVLPGATYTESWQSSALPPERFIPPKDIAEMIYASYNLSGRTVVEDLVIRPQLGDIRDGTD